MSDKYSDLAQHLRPYWLADDAKLTGITSMSSGGGGGALSAHALSGVYHTGELAESQAPWAGTKAELAAHALLANVHHAAATAGDGISVAGQAISLAAGVPGAGLVYSSAGVLAVGQGNGLTVGADAVALTTPGTLTVATTNDASGNHKHAITSSSVGAADAHILATDADGYTAVVKLRTPTIDTASGALSLAPNNNLVSLPSAVAIGTDNYTSQLTGWRATYAGEGDFRYLFVDEMHAKAFIADLEQALAGGQIISKSVALLAAPFTAPAAGGSAAITVRDLPSAPSMQVFQSGDFVRLRQFSRAAGTLSISDCWGQVFSHLDNGNGTQNWGFTRSAAPNAGAMVAGSVLAADSLVLDYGTSGAGYYEVNAIDGLYGLNSPYARIVKWTTHPATGSAVVGQFGNLRGAYGYTGVEYGLAVGEYAAGKANITIDPTNGVRLRSHSTDILQIKNSDGLGYIVGPLYLDTAGGIYQGTGTFGTPTTGIKLSNVSGYGKLGAYYGGVAQTIFDDQGLALQYNVTAGGITYGAQSSVIWYATPVSRTTPIGKLSVGQSPNYTYAPEVPPEDRMPALIYRSTILTAYPDIVVQNAAGAMASVWHQGNDGHTSGLDADTLDTYHAGSFALLAGATFTGTVVASNTTINIQGAGGALKIYDRDADGQYWQLYHNAGILSFWNATNGDRLSLDYNGTAIYQSTAQLAAEYYIASSGNTYGYVNYNFGASRSGYLLWNNTNVELYADAASVIKLSGGRVELDSDMWVGNSSDLSAKIQTSGNIYAQGALTTETFVQLKKLTGAPTKPGTNFVRFFALQTGLGGARFEFCVITENSTAGSYHVIWTEPS